MRRLSKCNHLTEVSDISDIKDIPKRTKDLDWVVRTQTLEPPILGSPHKHEILGMIFPTFYLG